MSEILSYINTSQWFVLIVGLCGIMSFISILISYISKRREYNLNLKMRTNCLIREYGLDDFEIVYKGVYAQYISETKIILWNNGTKVIRKNDLAFEDPIYFSIDENDTFFDSRIIFASSYSNGFKIESFSNNSFSLDFDYIEPREGCVIQVVHSGNSEKPIKHSGKIIGGSNLSKPLKKYKVFLKIFGHRDKNEPKPSFHKLNFAMIFIMAPMVYLFGYAIFMCLKEYKPYNPWLLFLYIPFMFFSMYWVMVIIVQFNIHVPRKFRKKYYQRGIVKD